MENRLNSRNFGASSATIAAATSVNRSGPSTTTRLPLKAVGTDGIVNNIQNTSAESPTLSHGSADPTCPAKRARKERQPNWQPREIDALIEAQKNMYLRELRTIDNRDLMQPDAGKWMLISDAVMRVGCSHCHRDGPTCKSKWNLLIPEYKRIIDFMARSGNNELSYWSLMSAEKKVEGLPRSFPEDVFLHIHGWYGKRPSVQPPHSRDLMSADDSNYRTPRRESDNVDEEGGIDEDPEDPFTIVASTEDSAEQTASTKSPSAIVGNAKATAFFGLSHRSPAASPAPLQKGFLPVGVTAQVISSSDTVEATVYKRLGNTVVRKKSVSGHSLIAEATRATGDAMAGQIKDMAEASRELERSKIDVQMHLFTQQMEYQRDRDRCLYDSACQANENAKLAILKKGQVVQCLSSLSSVLNVGLQQRQSFQGPPLDRPSVQPEPPTTIATAAGPSQPSTSTVEPADDILQHKST